MVDNEKIWCDRKKHHICEKDYIRNPSACICENERYLASIMDNSVIVCDELIEKTIRTNFNKNKLTCKTQNSIFYFHFY